MNGLPPGVLAGKKRDPYWSSVTSLVNFDGANGATTVTDQKGNTWTFNPTAKLTTADKMFGTASLDAAAGTATASIYTSASLGNFGLRDFTLECWVKSSSTGLYNMIFDKYSGLNDGFQLYFNASGYLVLYAATELGSATTGKVNDNQWHAVAVTRSGTTWRVFVDGVIVLTLTGISLNCNNTQNTYLCAQGSTGPKYPMVGYLDEFRITDGVCRYTTNYPPSGPFPNN